MSAAEHVHCRDGEAPVRTPGSAAPERTVRHEQRDAAVILQLQRTAGNRAVQRSFLGRPPTTVQRVTADERITAALEKPDPVAGVGDFAEAFRILNGLAMYDIVAVLTRLKGKGVFDLLNANLDRAVGVHVPRLRVGFRAVEVKSRLTPDQFAAEQDAILRTLPDDQRENLMKYLDPSWVPVLPLELLPTVPDEELGAQYELGLKGDPQRLQRVEDEIDRRVEAAAAVVPGGLAGGVDAHPPPASASAKVTPEVAASILENMSKGQPPWRPELGTKGGAAFFVAEGNPYVGIDATKSVEVGVEISGLNQNAMVFTEADLLVIYEEEAKVNAEAVKAEFRKRFKLPEGARVEDQNSRLRKAFKRLEKDFVESKMWDRVGERVAKSPSKVGKVILKNSVFSKSGDGVFAVVADANKIRVKGGVPALVKSIEDAGGKADPVVARAAEELAKKMAWAGKVRGVLRVGGRILIVVAVAVDAYEIYHAEDRLKKTIEKVGGWAGAAAAAELFSVVFAPADVAGPVAWAVHGVGILVAGGIGYYIGSQVSTWVYELVVV